MKDLIKKHVQKEHQKEARLHQLVQEAKKQQSLDQE